MEEIIRIEKFLFKNNDISNHKNYYNFLNRDNNKNIFFKIYETLKENKNNKTNKFIKKIEKKIENKIYMNDFIIVKSEKDLINFLLSAIILKSFSRQSIYDSKNEGIIQHMYKFNNNLALQFEKFMIFIEIILKVNIEIDFDKIFDFITETIYILINEKIIKKEIFVKNKKKKNFIYVENINYENSVLLCYNTYRIYEKNNISYLYSNHFYFVNKIFKKNIKSNYTFKTDVNSKFFENILNNSFFISKKMLKKNIRWITKRK